MVLKLCAIAHAEEITLQLQCEGQGEDRSGSAEEKPDAGALDNEGQFDDEAHLDHAGQKGLLHDNQSQLDPESQVGTENPSDIESHLHAGSYAEEEGQLNADSQSREDEELDIEEELGDEEDFVDANESEIEQEPNSDCQNETEGRFSNKGVFNNDDGLEVYAVLAPTPLRTAPKIPSPSPPSTPYDTPRRFPSSNCPANLQDYEFSPPDSPQPVTQVYIDVSVLAELPHQVRLYIRRLEDDEDLCFAWLQVLVAITEWHIRHAGMEIDRHDMVQDLTSVSEQFPQAQWYRDQRPRWPFWWDRERLIAFLVEYAEKAWRQRR
jgi:hypothetical protein